MSEALTHCVFAQYDARAHGDDADDEGTEGEGNQKKKKFHQQQNKEESFYDASKCARLLT